MTKALFTLAAIVVISVIAATISASRLILLGLAIDADPPAEVSVDTAGWVILLASVILLTGSVIAIIGLLVTNRGRSQRAG
ncbi:hypothetical protein LWF01_04410 [Saxibacter everestensis]|uniref:Uncharacterized protein n=1 Tax=Saxibacter everestensis TaxID=2909229 RepID=A0ABY8QVR0_9MICO|nr:hypothetical protein LWF01_04410 [Brevibacteriaceae bacterium ZFBP1038]